MKETATPLREVPFHAQSLWQPVAGAAVSTLARSFTRRELDEGGALYHQGAPSDGVYCVSRGLIAIRSFGPDGASSLLRLAYPGDLVGYRAFLTGRGHRTEARALMPSRVCVVARRDAQRVSRPARPFLPVWPSAAPTIWIGIRSVSRRSRVCPTRRAWLRLLDQLMTAHGEAEGDIRSMHLPISRRDLADILGVQPETLSRLMKRLEAEGLLRSSGRMIVIRQRPPDRPWSEACRG